MRKWIAVLLAVPGLALAQGLNPSPPGVSGGKKVSTVDVAFSTPGCYPSGSSGVIGLRSPSNATYFDANGINQACGVDSYRVEPSGILVEPASANYMRSSSAIYSNISPAGTAAWLALSGLGSATVTGAPDGGSWIKLSKSNADAQLNQVASGIPAGRVFTFSAWVAAESGTTTVQVYAYCITTAPAAASSCACVRSDGGGCTAGPLWGATPGCGAHTNVGTAGARLSVTTTCPGDNTSISVGLVPGIYGTPQAISGLFAMTQLEVASLPSSYIGPTAGTGANRSADDVRISAKLFPKTNWSLSADFKTAASHGWANKTLFALDGNTVADGNNSSRLGMGTSDLVWSVIDAGGTTGTVTYTPSWAAGSSHAIKVTNSNGTLSMTCDGSSCGTAAGSANVSGPLYLYLGRKSDSTSYFTGWIKSLKVTSP